MRLPLFLALLPLPALPLPALAEVATPVTLPEWKSVQATVETTDRIAARARLGGTLVALQVTEGDVVTEGQVIATLQDDKLAFQLQALDAQLTAAQAQLTNARDELARGESLKAQGVTTAQHLDQLRTQADVASGQIATLTAQRRVIEEQVAEGQVKAPIAGRVIAVPVARGAVLMPGEVVAQVAGGGTFLRLAIPERHAARLKAGDALRIETSAGEVQGRLAKVYPLIEAGRVQADVEVQGLGDFVGARVLVRLAVGSHPALVVPVAALITRQGLDFVATPEGDRLVLPGERVTIDGKPMVEILSGLQPGDQIEGASE